MKTTAEKIHIHHKPFIKLTYYGESTYCPVSEFFACAIAIGTDGSCLSIRTASYCYYLWGWSISDYETFLKENNI